MDLNEIENRFTQIAQKRYKESTLTQYKTNFRRLFEKERLEKYTRRQLASPKGKELLLDHMSNHIKRPSLSSHQFGSQCCLDRWPRPYMAD
jgi:hypothetical protein